MRRRSKRTARESAPAFNPEGNRGRVTAYDGGYYYPTAYYTPSYDYYGSPYSYYEYGPRYCRTAVRSGVRYYDSYGPRYYGY